MNKNAIVNFSAVWNTRFSFKNGSFVAWALTVVCKIIFYINFISQNLLDINLCVNNSSSVHTSHCWAQVSSHKEKVFSVVSPRAQCDLGTWHTSQNCFADVPVSSRCVPAPSSSKIVHKLGILWGASQGSNPRPSAWEALGQTIGYHGILTATVFIMWLIHDTTVDCATLLAAAKYTRPCIGSLRLHWAPSLLKK